MLPVSFGGVAPVCPSWDGLYEAVIEFMMNICCGLQNIQIILSGESIGWYKYVDILCLYAKTGLDSSESTSSDSSKIYPAIRTAKPYDGTAPSSFTTIS